MAKPSTTHVIEIETGIGEPAFIPLTMGQELQPISVGKKGMWRIESARVLDVHAFVYFDGTSLFLQSADESASASVDGYRVGKAWTELHAPCKIEIGAARLRFRSLLAGAEPEPPPPQQQVSTGPQLPDAPRPAAGAGIGAEPLTFPKPDRPFKPGEFANVAPPGESTRVKPLDNTGARPAAQTGSVVSAAPRPAAGRPALGAEDNPTRAEGSGNLNRTAGMPAYEGGPQHDSTMGMPNGGPPMMQGVQPVQPIPGGMGGMPMGMQPNMGMPNMGGMQQGPGGSGGYPYPPPGGTGPYNAMGPGAMGANQSGGYGSMTTGQVGGGPQPAEGSVPYYVAKYKELSPPKRILVILAPFCLIAAGYLLLFDEAPQEGPLPTASADAGTDALGAAATQPTQPNPTILAPATQPLPQPQCPPGFVPYTIPINGQIPCVPAGTPMPTPDAGRPQPQPTQPQPTQPQPQPTQPQPQPTQPQPPASQTPVAANTKTLERQAVDYVAVNDYAHAAAVYEELQRQNPQNRVYAEAARILRQKADAGVP